MSDIAIGRATDDEVRAYARRRYADESARRLYLELAESASDARTSAADAAWVARDAGEPVGIAFAHYSDDERFVSELYVEPSFRGQGIGAELLAKLGEDDDAPRTGVVEAGDSASTAFAVARGAPTQASLLYLTGALPREDRLLALAAGSHRFGVQSIDIGAHGYALGAIDREVRGTTRQADHARWSQRATGTAFFVQEELVGYAYVWPSGRIGPVAVVSGAYAAQIFAFALTSSARVYGASWCSLLLPTVNLRTARAAFAIGLRVERTLLIVGDTLPGDPSRYAAFDRLLL